jgi:hypothetical protein
VQGADHARNQAASDNAVKTFKTRHQFYLPDDLSERLDTLAAKPGASKTTILTDALRAWLDRKAGDEMDQRFGPRLDRQTKATNRVESRVDQMAGALDLFIFHQLTLVAHQPPFDEATARLGRARYERFMDQVARRLQARSDTPGSTSGRDSDDE